MNRELQELNELRTENRKPKTKQNQTYFVRSVSCTIFNVKITILSM